MQFGAGTHDFVDDQQQLPGSIALREPIGCALNV